MRTASEKSTCFRNKCFLTRFSYFVHGVLVLPSFSRRWSLTTHTCCLHQNQRRDIFQLAEGEISRVQADNLLNDFRASSVHKERVDDENLQGEISDNTAKRFRLSRQRRHTGRQQLNYLLELLTKTQLEAVSGGECCDMRRGGEYGSPILREHV